MGGDEEETGQQVVSHVSVKAPVFYRKSPETWFRQLEAQFTLARVTSSETKFCHTIAALPEDIACHVLTDSMNQYEDIKAAVITHLKANKHQLINEALSTLELGEMRPTQYVAEVKRRFNDLALLPTMP